MKLQAKAALACLLLYLNTTTEIIRGGLNEKIGLFLGDCNVDDHSD
jgi:hypothetical protein